MDQTWPGDTTSVHSLSSEVYSAARRLGRGSTGGSKEEATLNLQD